MASSVTLSSLTVTFLVISKHTHCYRTTLQVPFPDLAKILLDPVKFVRTRREGYVCGV